MTVIDWGLLLFLACWVAIFLCLLGEALYVNYRDRVDETTTLERLRGLDRPGKGRP